MTLIVFHFGDDFFFSISICGLGIKNIYYLIKHTHLHSMFCYCTVVGYCAPFAMLLFYHLLIALYFYIFVLYIFFCRYPDRPPFAYDTPTGPNSAYTDPKAAWDSRDSYRERYGYKKKKTRDKSSRSGHSM